METLCPRDLWVAAQDLYKMETSLVFAPDEGITVQLDRLSQQHLMEWFTDSVNVIQKSHETINYVRH